ncbi:MAG TPA: protein translocase subunit SecD [Actinomycetota bacterium]|nr:protein translocase subunit SecD [Actinomycetota bacterium]
MRGVGRLITSVVFMLTLVGASLYGLMTDRIRPVLGLDLVGGVSVTLTAPEGTQADRLDKTLEVIRDRVDAFGVAEPDITREGERNILIQVPGLEEGQERLLQLVGRTAQLEFRIVEQAIAPNQPEYQQTRITPENAPKAEVQKAAVYPGADEDRAKYRLGPVLMTGEALDTARAVFNDPATATDPGSSGWIVSFRLNGDGSDTFATITRENSGRQLAIVLDRRVESAPSINEEISGGEGQISGGFQEREAKDLALVLQTGALPVELERSEVLTVSATLGRESLDQGLKAGVVGLILLAIYLAIYYRLLGIVTWFGMVIWAVLSMAIVALLGEGAGYSLTLAGVAGLVVSIGVTADSYIVFYERLKDEIRNGKSVRTAVQPAFKRAWRTILAANTVTIAAAVVLYFLAVGSVRGFALTLGLATFLDMFVVYFFKRPLVFLIARSRFLSDLPGMGLRSGVAVGEAVPARGGAA